MDDPRPSDADVAAAHHELMDAYAASPMSGQPATGEPEPAVAQTPPPVLVGKPSAAPLVFAWIWFAISMIAGAQFILGTQFDRYGGDAYTGIQNAVARGTNALGFLIIGTGFLAVVIALRSRTTK